MRFTKSRAALTALVAVVALLPGAAHAAPVGSDVVYVTEGLSVAVGTCTVVAVDHGEGRRTYVVAGHAKAVGAVATSVGCGIVQNGVVIAYFRAALPGSVAAGVWTTVAGDGTYSVCADVSATFGNGSVEQNNCP